MTMKDFTNMLDEKIEENEKIIRITFYEVRVKCNLSKEETEEFLKLAKIRFENMGYNVYFTDAQYTYQNERKTVSPNELMIAIKQ